MPPAATAIHDDEKLQHPLLVAMPVFANVMADSAC
jgi:hypothetical protein